MNYPVGSQVIVESERGLVGTVVETRGDRLRCQLQDGRSVWVGEKDVRPRHARRIQREEDPLLAVPSISSASPFAVETDAPRHVFAVSSAEEPRRSWWWLFFSLQGRIPRAQYWLGSFVSSLLAMAPLLVVLVLWFQSVQSWETLPDDPLEWGTETEWAQLFGVILFVSLPAAWMQVALAVKRWHDRDKSGLWLLVYLVPYLGAFWAFVELGCLRGTPGPNRYGADPLQS